MRDFVSYPSAGSERLHCTMKRTEDDPEVGGPCYTLYLEHLGGLVPILKGRRISKLRPEFVIMDPRTDGRAGAEQVGAGQGTGGLAAAATEQPARRPGPFKKHEPCGLASSILEAAPFPESHRSVLSDGLLQRFVQLRVGHG